MSLSSCVGPFLRHPQASFPRHSMALSLVEREPAQPYAAPPPAAGHTNAQGGTFGGLGHKPSRAEYFKELKDIKVGGSPPYPSSKSGSTSSSPMCS